MSDESASSGPLHSLLSVLWDFLSFEVLITPSFLILAYYIGALLLPALFVLGFRRAAQGDAIKSELVNQLADLVRSANTQAPISLYLLALLSFLLVELVWRMMIETLIVYFEIGENVHRACS